MNTDNEVNRRVLTKAARRLLAKLPLNMRDDPDARILARALTEYQGIDLVHLIYRRQHYESHAKDYEFSRLSMEEHWRAGRADMTRTLQDPRWLGREQGSRDVRVFDLTLDKPM